VNGEELKSTIAEAALISPTIHQRLQFCPEIQTFRIDDDKLTLKDLSRFLDFVHSRLVTDFSREEQISFLSICGLLGNIRLTFLLLESLHGMSEDQKSAVMEFGDIDANVCSAKFCGYSNEVIKRIEKGMLHEILKSPELKLENEDAFLTILISLGTEYFEFWEYVEVKHLTDDGISLFIEHLPFDELTESIWERITDRLRSSKPTDLNRERCRDVVVVGFESLIVKDCPNILSDFENKVWKLLYRGSRDGFGASNFHEKCDNESNTLTLIETTKGFIFDGFTPLVWDSTTNGYKSDNAQKSFVFTLKNAGNIQPRTFKLLNGSYAIFCYSPCGPTFGSGIIFVL
jgi:hypothetical protein